MILKGMNIEKYFLSLYQFDEIEKLILKYADETCTPILSPIKSKILSNLILIKNPKNVFEIGLGIGFSTYSILKSLNNNSSLITIDKNFHRVEFFYEKIYKKLRKNFKKKLTVYPLDAIYVVDIFINIRKKFDFIFIDSQKRDYFNLIDLVIKIVNKKGIILIDNITYKHQIYNENPTRSEKYKEGIDLVDKFNKKIVSMSNFSVSFIPAGDGMALIIKQ